MRAEHEVRRVSKQRYDALRDAGRLRRAMVLDMIDGILLVQPAGSGLADGEALSPSEADYELQPAFFLGRLSELRDARRRLGLEVGRPAPAMAR